MHAQNFCCSRQRKETIQRTNCNCKIILTNIAVFITLEIIWPSENVDFSLQIMPLRSQYSCLLETCIPLVRSQWYVFMFTSKQLSGKYKKTQKGAQLLLRDFSYISLVSSFASDRKMSSQPSICSAV